MARPINEVMMLIEPIQYNFQKSLDEIRNNPEFNFLRLVEKHNFSENEIIKGLQIVEDNLNPILDQLQVRHLWLGANFALYTSAEENPDRIRHFFISVRTLIEYFIDTLLAPDEKVRVWGKFDELLEIHLKKNNITSISKISRAIRIKYFCSKIQFGILEEFTEKEIKFVNELYKNVCMINSPKINLSREELDLLKLHTGTTIWLLSKLYLIIEGRE